MIDLGLKRISSLVQSSSLPWKAIHVAGTNGKGSVCAYIASCLHASGISCGRFTSPHLVNRWDCVEIRNTPVSRSAFLAAERSVLELNQAKNIGATEFELLTATAFELFTRANVAVGVVEVGIGGRLDATNILEKPLCTVITKIGLDHQGFLGNTIAEIAAEKAGILKAGVPVVVDGSNELLVRSVVTEVADRLEARKVHFVGPRVEAGICEIQTAAFGKHRFEKYLPGGYQPANLACAVTALACASEEFPQVTKESVEKGIAATKWPGRLEMLDVSQIVGKDLKVLVDGAHNPAAAQELRSYVDSRFPGTTIWVLAFSQGKDVAEMLRMVVKPGDTTVATGFGAVDGMPWVTPADTREIVFAANQLEDIDAVEEENTIDALRRAADISEIRDGNVVVAGSLYLVGELARALSP